MTRLSSSLPVGAVRNVRPLTVVSTSAVAFVAADTIRLCTNVKLNIRSSSFERRRRKDGGIETVPLSGS